MKNIKLKKYETPSIRMEEVLLQDNLSNSSLIIEDSGSFYPQVNDWENDSSITIESQYYDL